MHHPCSLLRKLGTEIQKARVKRGASLDAVAKPAKISAAYLHKLERGVVNTPSPRVLGRLAAALEVSYLHLMELAGYLDEAQVAEARKREPTRSPHPLEGQELTQEEWREVGAFIKDLIARRT